MLKSNLRMALVCAALLLLTLNLCLPVASWAAGGDYVWPAYNVAAVGKQEAKASMADSQGNLIIVGSTDSNGTDFHVVKVKADGSGTLWSVTYDATGGADVATAVVVDSQDDVIVTGYVWDGAAYNDIYTAKYAAADGALIWDHTFDGTGSGNDFPTAITVDDVGYVYVGGYMQAPSTKDSFILLKYDPTNGPNPDGSPLWEISYDAGFNGHDRIYAIVADDVHGVAVTGESQNATPDFDCLTVKYDTSGNQTWVRRYSDTGDGRGQALAMDATGNVVMAGYVSNGSNLDFYVIEYAAADSPARWVNIYDSGQDDKANAIWLDADDHVYVAGNDSTLTTGSDVHVAKYDGATGVEVWSDSYNTSGGHNDVGLDIIGDSDGELFIAGYKNDALGGADDVLTLKLKKDTGTQLWSKEYDGAGKTDRSMCACLAPDGNLLVGGWSDRWTSGSSDYDFLVLKYESGALNPPTSLTAEVMTNTSVDLSWDDNSSSEESFIVERKIGAAGSYNEIVTLGANISSYSDTGLTADTRYYYRVSAYSTATGHSPYSNEVDAKTTVISYAAPTLQFQFGGADAGDDYAEAVAVGADNHPVVTGFITGATTSFDYYTIKLDRADLSELWHARYNDGDNEVDVADAITVDSSNRVVVTGYSSLYGGGAGNTNDVYTIGYPADGSVESWTDQYNGPDGNDDRSSAVASALDGSNNTVVVGYGKNAAFNDDIYVLKFQPDGTRVWAATPYDGGSDDYPAAVAFDPAGDIMVAGYTNNGSNKDFFAAKYSGGTGSQIWVKTFNGAGNGDDYINALAVDADGNLYVTGYSVNAAGNGDIYTIKYAASDGNLLWQKALDGVGNGYDVGEGITFDPVDGSIMVGGTTFVGSGNHDYQLIRYAADGNLVWQKTLDRPGSDEALYAMSIDRSGTVCLTGTTNSGANDDVLTVKYDSDGIIVGASVYNGSADRDDAPAAITSNAYGETFVAGFTTNAANDTDYMVFLAAGETMQSPTPFTAVQLYTQVDLSWVDNSLDETGFRLQRKIGSCTSTDPWTDLYTAAAGETSYANTGLSIDSTFCYRIRSFNAAGDSSRWAELEVTTADPVAPSGLTATVLNTTDVQLDWTDNTGNEEGFVVERCLGTSCDFSTIDTTIAPADAVTFTDIGACPGETYSYRIKSYRSNEWSTGYSNVVVDKTTASPVAATDFALSLISEQQVDLSWTDNSTDETGFKIERCAGSGCSDFTEVGSVLADEVSYSDTGLQYNTLYRYRVTPYKTMACTVPVPAYTAILDVTTTPPVPSSFTAVSVSSTQMNLTWVDGTAGEEGFKIERCQGAGCAPTLIAVTGADVTRYVDDTLCAGLDYRYRVRAYSGALWDSASSVVDVTAVMPLTPVNYSVAAVSEQGIDLDWSMIGYDLSGYLIKRCEGAACTPSSQLADIPSGRVLALSMEEASWDGTVNEVKDRSGAGNHGTSYNSATTVIDGKHHWGADFAGSSSYVLTPLMVNQNSDASGATYEAWVYPVSTNGVWRGIISTENGGYDWSLMQYGSTWRVYNGISSWTAGSVTVDTWQHLVVVFKPGTGVSFFKNGVKSFSSSLGYDTLTNPINLGRRANGSLYFDGKIDEVMIYDRALTDAEVQARYNAGNTAAGTLAGQYNDTGLAPATTYGYQLVSYSADDCAGTSAVESDPTTTLYATTLSPLPPSGFSATAINSTQIALAWTDNTDSETGFTIERCSGSGISCDEDAEFSLLTTTAGDAVSYVDQSVCYGQTYTYRVAAEKTDGPNWLTTWAASDNATTLSVATPADFAATAQSEVQIDLSWSDTLTDEDSYVIEKCVGSGTACDEDSEFSPLVSFDHRQVLAEATLWMKMDEVSWGPVYNSAVTGNNGTEYGDATPVDDAERGQVGQFDGNGDYIMINNYPGINPSAAITLSIWAKSATADWNNSTYLMSKRNSYLIGPSGVGGMQFWVFIDANWRQLIVADMGIDITQWHQYTGTYDGSNLILYVDGQEIGRLAYSGAINADTGPLMLGRDDNYTRYLNGWLDDALVFDRAIDAAEVESLYLNAAGTIYHDTGLSPATSYSYRLRSSKAATCNWTTAWELRSATTLDPPPPTDLTVTAISTTSIGIDWTDNSGSETSYNLERCPGSGTACDEDVEFSTLDAGLVTDTATYTDASVCEGTTYSYRVRAEKSDGPTWQTSWAGPSAATTGTQTTPSGLSASWVSEVQIDLTWTDNSSDETGFKIERCTGTACGNFAEIAIVAADVTTYQDDQLDPGVSYSYRLKAFKTAACSWETVYTGTVSETTSITVPSGLVAAMVNSTQIDLNWTDNAVTETSTIIERCAGSGCSSFAVHDEIGGNLTSYADVDACYGTTYNYRLKIKNNGLDGGGCWTRRTPLNFTGFIVGAVTQLVVPYDPDMRTDFGDLRFYDEDGKRQLPYFIASKTDGLTATIQLKLGKNQNISMYYGNATATDIGNEDDLLLFYDDFTGTVIDSNKWVEIDPTNSIAQNNDLLLLDVVDGWTKALISTTTFDRAVGRELYFSLTIASDTAGTNSFMSGWELNQTSNPSYNQLVHGLFWSNYSFNTYEKGGSKGGTGSYAAATSYEIKIVLKSNGATYHVKGGTYNDWTLIKDNSNYSDAIMRIAFTQNSQQANIHVVKVKEVIIDTGISRGAEETSGCYAFTNTWEQGYSNQSEATTSSPTAPAGLTAVAIADTQFDLNWTDNTDAESGFKIERCSGSSCSDFIQIDTVGTDQTSYIDTTAQPSIESSYRVRAFKSSSCSWDSEYSNAATDLSFPAASTSLAATALNSRMIQLGWDDNAADEDGYEVEVLTDSGEFVKIADLPANTTSFVDTMSLQAETEYFYRVRPYRGLDIAPYSNVASDTTPAYVAGDGTCPP